MIAICVNPFRDKNCRIGRELAALLSENGCESCICPVFGEGDELMPPDLPIRDFGEVVSQCSLVVVVGGDGTILNVTRRLHGVTVPILGINLGTKGFMASLEPGETEYVLKAAKGEYKLSRRMMLETELIRDGQCIYTDFALNDAVMHGYGDCIKLTALCAGAKITEFSGDGLILSTPTGSTGYSMSAGGPIVEPDAENIIVSPICAHSMSSRSFVLGPDREVEVLVEKLHGRKAYLSIDGNFVMDLKNRDKIVVRRASRYTHMADMGLRSFYDIAFTKLR